MSWAVRCSECETIVWPPADACGAGGQTEIAALRLALEHVQQSGHTDVEPMAGVYYVGDGRRPTSFGGAAGVDVKSDDYVTPPRGKLVADLQFAIKSLRDQATRLERRGEADDHVQPATIGADQLQERAALLERKLRERADHSEDE